MADRSEAAKKATKTLKLKRAGQKAALTKKRRAAAKKAATTKRNKDDLGKITYKELTERGIRLPNSYFKIPRFLRWIERWQDMPEGCLRCFHPNGEPAKPEDTLATMKESWHASQQE